MALLLAGFASCRNDEPGSREPSNLTTAAPPAEVVNTPAGMGPAAAIRPDESGPSGIAVEDGSVAIQSETANGQPAAENPLGGCDICHVDVEDEFVGTLHHAEAIGCVKCHGPSDGHVADENNEVPPDRLFATADIDAFCGECHECSRPSAAPGGKRKVCIDCHGAHDLRLAESQ